MTDKMYETEVKVYVPDLARLGAKIESVGGVLTAERVLERNIRYDNKDRSLDSAGSVLRLRQDSRARLTFKEGDRVIGKYGSTRFEAEVEISDFDTMEVILYSLGFMPSWRYEKYRTTYTLMDTEIVLDELPFGNFAEIEGEDEQIGRVLRLLDLRDSKRFTVSYSALFRRVRDRLGLSFDDLTFDNFKGIAIPPTLFSESEPDA